jgi:hypothetical protein
MKQELLRKWVDALESGRYEQAHTALRVDNGYCCLGVLCDLAGEGRWVPPTEDEIIKKDYFVMGDVRERNVLPYPLAELVGVTEAQEKKLVEANDNKHETFLQIAQRIRKMFPDVFTESVV